MNEVGATRGPVMCMMGKVFGFCGTDIAQFLEFILCHTCHVAVKQQWFFSNENPMV